MPTPRVVALFIFALAVFPTHTAAHEDDKLQSLEYCETDDQCRPSLNCEGIVNGHPIGPCAKNPGYCLCVLPDGKLPRCESSSQCHEDEACIHSDAGKQFCIGCEVVRNTSRPYTLVNASTDCGELPWLLGQRYDFCSPDLHCAGDYSCMTADGPTYQDVPCRSFHSRCWCDTSEDGFCDKSDDCSVGETCALATKKGKYVCTSCSVERLDIYRISDNRSSCENIPPRKVPDYARCSNGLMMDVCRNDVMCTGGRVCLNQDGLCVLNSTNCHCEELAEVRCNTSSECPTGEFCAKARRLGQTCVSKAIVDVTGWDEVEPIGVVPEDPHPPLESGLYGDQCQFDWDCLPSRRCRHANSFYGGCDGRRACQCRSLYPRPCDFNDDCMRGEICANVRDARSGSYCVSAVVVRMDEDLSSLPDLRLPEKPSPETPSAPIVSFDRVSIRLCVDYVVLCEWVILNIGVLNIGEESQPPK